MIDKLITETRRNNIMENDKNYPILNQSETGYQKNGETEMNKEYIKAMSFHAPEGLAAVKDETGAYHISTDGQPAYDVRFVETYGFYGGIATVKTDKGFSHIDTNGFLLHNRIFKWSGNFQENVCVVCDQNGYYHIDQKGVELYSERYQYAGDFKYEIACVSQNGKWFHILKNGKKLHNNDFEQANVYHKGYSVVRDQTGFFHIDKNGNEIYRKRFSYLEPFYNGVALAKTIDGYWVRVRESGHFTHIPVPENTITTEGIIREIDSGKTLTIVLRHSEREKINKNEWGMEKPLTPNGRKIAEVLGTKLKINGMWRLFSSPVGRCIETAECFSKGVSGKNGDVTSSHVFGEPGAFKDSANPVDFNPENFSEVATKYIADGIMEGFLPLVEGCQNMIDFVNKKASCTNAFICTHDLFVAGLAEFLGLKNPTKGDWADYLEGVVFIFSNGNLEGWRLFRGLDEVQSC